MSWQEISAIAGILGLVIALGLKIVHAISEVRDDLAAYKLAVAGQVKAASDDLAAFKLLVSEHYSRDGDIREVEIRVLGQVTAMGQNLGAQVKDLTTEMRDMHRAFDELRKELIKRRGG